MTTSDCTSNIPYGYCQCGCGQKTTISPSNNKPYGYVKGEPRKYIQGHFHITLPKEDHIDRFWAHVNKDGSIPAHCPEIGQCWEWFGGISSSGYGSKRWNGNTLPTHRVSWIINYGSIPDDLYVLHKCDNRSCVRPDHLFLGTDQDNVDDRVRKGRNGAAHGEKSSMAKLTETLVIEMRGKYQSGDISFKKLANEYGISVGHVAKIINKQVWKHVK